MKSKEEILDKYLKDNHGPAETYRDILKAMKEYAQQPQPSGMSAEEVKEIAENHFKNTTWLEGTQEQDTKFGFRIGYMKAMKDFAIQNPSTASPAGAAEGASEGISKIREVMNWISQCVDEDHDLEVSEIKMIWNDLSDAISLIESTPHSSEGMAEALRLKWINLTEDMGRLLSGQRGVSIDKLNKAMNLVQDFVNTMPASLSPGVEDGSGWVKVEDRLPENAGWVNDTVMFWSKKHGHALIGCYDFEFDDWTQQPWTEGAEKLKSSDVTHWRPLPTPPGVEDNQTKKQ